MITLRNVVNRGDALQTFSRRGGPEGNQPRMTRMHADRSRAPWRNRAGPPRRVSPQGRVLHGANGLKILHDGVVLIRSQLRLTRHFVDDGSEPGFGVGPHIGQNMAAVAVIQVK